MEKQREVRFITSEDLEIETRDDGTPTKIGGYAALFNTLSGDLGGFREVIRPGAFTRSLRNADDIVANVNHNDEKPLARLSAGTLELNEDHRGLHFEFNIPNTTDGRDCAENIRNGNYSGCSFAFFTPDDGDSFREEQPGSWIRELHNVDLFDVSVVTRPAYAATEVSLRSLEKAKREKVELPEVPPVPPTVPPMSAILMAQYDAELQINLF